MIKLKKIAPNHLYRPKPEDENLALSVFDRVLKYNISVLIALISVKVYVSLD